MEIFAGSLKSGFDPMAICKDMKSWGAFHLVKKLGAKVLWRTLEN